MSTTAGRRAGRSWFSIWHVALLLPWVILGIAARSPIRDNSFLWHVRAGTVQLDRGAVITTDPFSFTALGRPWRTQSWLAELGYGWLERRVGLSFVPWMIFLVGGIFFAGLMVIAFGKVRHPLGVAAFMVLSGVLTAGYLNPRPVLLSFALFALVVIADEHRRLRWTLPILLWVWACVHGSFVIGGGYLILSALRRRDREAWKVIVPAGVAALLTAHGLGILEILLDFLGGRGALAHIVEWGRPDFLSLPLFPFLLGLLGVIVAAMRGRLRPGEFWVLLPFVVFGFSANRAVLPAWIGLSTVFVLAFDLFHPKQRNLAPAQTRVNLVAAGLVAVIPFLVPLKGGLDPKAFPIQAATHLTEARVFHDDGAGGYLIYAQWPKRLVYIDDRAELYHTELPEFIEARGGLPVWREVFDRYGLREALLRTKDPLLETLRLAGWHETYRDETFVIMHAP